MSPPAEIDLVTTTEGDDDIYFMVSTEYKTQKLIVVVRSDCAEAYRQDSTKVWSIGGSLPGVEGNFNPYGVSADDDGHLLVCDTKSNCIRMFSLDDGSYMGVVMSIPQCIEAPLDLGRCGNKSIFVLESADPRRIDFVKIEIDSVKECAESISFEDLLAEEQCTG